MKSKLIIHEQVKGDIIMGKHIPVRDRKINWEQEGRIPTPFGKSQRNPYSGAIWIKKSDDGQYYSVIKAKNGKNLYTSEMVKQKRSAFKGAESALRMFIGPLPEDVSGWIVDKTGE